MATLWQAACKGHWESTWESVPVTPMRSLALWWGVYLIRWFFIKERKGV